MDDANQGAIDGCVETCRRCRVVIEEGERADPSGAAFAALGPHLRHCLDHFLALLRGLGSGCIDYDARARDPEVERNPEKALALIDAVTAQLEALRDKPGDTPVLVAQLGDLDAPPSTVPSSLARELLFLSSHTVHHLAIMVELARARDLALPDDFGVAFSTARHRDASRNRQAERV